MKVSALFGFVGVALAGPLLAQAPGSPEGEGSVHEMSRTLVASVSGVEEGAAVLVGLGRDSLFLVTAGHVVVDRVSGVPAGEVHVRFDDGRGVRVAKVRAFDLDLDLAVLTVRAEPADPRRIPDRLGDVSALEQGTAVHPIGCPNTRCHVTPVSDDRVQGLSFGLIEFQSPAIAPGSSGGALFNTEWEVVGVLLSTEPPYGIALSIDAVARRLRDWAVPFQLTYSSIPRAGYRVSFSSAALVPGGGDELGSGRVSMVRRGSAGMSWHVSGLRLAPENLRVLGVLGGVGYEVALWRRLRIRPLVEVGFATISSQYDIGGWVDDTGEYNEVFRRLEAGSVGWGYGANASVVLLRGLALDVQVGKWSFATPVIPAGAQSVEAAPELDDWFWGLGLRYGIAN